MIFDQSRDFYIIILIFQVPERLYQLVDRSTDGLVTADQVMEFIAGLQSIRYDKSC